MKRIIAIVAGGDSSEHDVSLRSAEGIDSFLDKEKYEVYTIEIKGTAWEAHLKDGRRAAVDRNDFSFADGEQRIRPDFAYITRTASSKATSTSSTCPIPPQTYWWKP